MTGASCTVAVDAMGGDRAPGEVVAGALEAATTLDVEVLLHGRIEELRPLLPDPVPARLTLVDTRDVIAMDDEPLAAVRKQKDSSIVRCARAVRDGAADAMVSAGNTGAVTAAAVLRMKRFHGVPSPAIAVPIPVPGHHPQVLVDAGAVVDASPSGCCSTRGWAVRTPAPATGSTPPRSGCSPTVRSPARATPCAARPTSCCAASRASSATSKAPTSCTPAAPT